MFRMNTYIYTCIQITHIYIYTPARILLQQVRMYVQLHQDTTPDVKRIQVAHCRVSVRVHIRVCTRKCAFSFLMSLAITIIIINTIDPHRKVQLFKFHGDVQPS